MSTETQRAEFEALLRVTWTAGYACPKDATGQYLDKEVRTLWKFWQAAQASQAVEIAALKAKLASYEAHGVTCQTFGHVVGACAECNTHGESVEALKAENEALRKDAGKLRQMLGMQWCAGQGVYPYTDDGQFFDGSVFPTIDFMADSPDEIEKKFVARMKNASAERMKNAAQEPPTKRKYVRKAAAMQTKEAS